MQTKTPSKSTRVREGLHVRDLDDGGVTVTIVAYRIRTQMWRLVGLDGAHVAVRLATTSDSVPDTQGILSDLREQRR